MQNLSIQQLLRLLQQLVQWGIIITPFHMANLHFQDLSLSLEIHLTKSLKEFLHQDLQWHPQHSILRIFRISNSFLERYPKLLRHRSYLNLNFNRSSSSSSSSSSSNHSMEPHATEDTLEAIRVCSEIQAQRWMDSPLLRHLVVWYLTQIWSPTRLRENKREMSSLSSLRNIRIHLFSIICSWIIRHLLNTPLHKWTFSKTLLTFLLRILAIPSQ